MNMFKNGKYRKKVKNNKAVNNIALVTKQLLERK